MKLHVTFAGAVIAGTLFAAEPAQTVPAASGPASLRAGAGASCDARNLSTSDAGCRGAATGCRSAGLSAATAALFAAAGNHPA